LPGQAPHNTIRTQPARTTMMGFAKVIPSWEPRNGRHLGRKAYPKWSGKAFWRYLRLRL